ncbi:trypsin-like serine protease [Streptomyces sp. NPDC003077]|uniref:trypsin-like serine protease n=1 Tax=Streptomyces sp. NPDC003077 TaxID=3154443 RepID=UPI0033B12A87
MSTADVRRRALATAVIASGVLALTGCSSASPADATGTPSAVPSAVPSATPFDGIPAVGALIRDGDHFCTASVVDSPRGNVLATAAHCVYTPEEEAEDGDEPGYIPGRLEFAPRSSGTGPGAYPYGKWKVTGIHVGDLWKRDNEDQGDYAFLTVEPNEDGRTVQEVVGAAVPDFSSGFRRHVTVIGYPNEDHNPDNRPVRCSTTTRRDDDEPYMLRIDCAGLWSGTSGSPWLADHHDPHRPGRLIGVLSGGDTDTESVAVRFDERAREVYERAVRG